MKGKKLLASMLSVAMVLSSMSFTALADNVVEESAAAEVQVTAEQKNEVPAEYTISTLSEADVEKAITENGYGNTYAGENGLYHQMYKKVAAKYNNDTSKVVWGLNLHMDKNTLSARDFELSSEKDASFLVVMPTKDAKLGTLGFVVNLNDANNHTKAIGDFLEGREKQVYNQLWS